MAGSLSSGLGSSPVKIQVPWINSCIWLLVRPPEKIMVRIEIFLTNTLDESRKIEIIPIHIQVQTKAVAGAVVTNDFQIAGIGLRISKCDLIILILVYIPRPAFYN